MEKLFTYTHLKSDEDTSNSHYRGLLDRMTSLAHECRAELAWVGPEIIGIDDKVMGGFLQDPALALYRFELENILRYKPHTLSPNEEKIMAMQAEIGHVPYNVFSC